jgi:hypothetical protein
MSTKVYNTTEELEKDITDNTLMGDGNIEISFSLAIMLLPYLARENLYQN